MVDSIKQKILKILIVFIIGAVFSVPAWIVSGLVGNLDVVVIYPLLVDLICCVILFRIIRDSLGGKLLYSVLAGILYAFLFLGVALYSIFIFARGASNLSFY